MCLTSLEFFSIMAFWLFKWWRQGQGRRLPLRFVLYTRAGCHLCDEAAATLAAARRRYCFGLEVMDVDADPALAEQYGLEVPVVTVDGKLRFRGRVNAVLLDRLLHAAAGKEQM